MKRVLAVTFFVTLSLLTAAAQSSVRVQFPAGRTTATLEGKVDEATLGKIDYILRARAGQQLIVHITSPARNAHFRIYQKDYDAPLAGAEDARDWRGALPASGDYHIYVFPAGTGTVPFTLEITIPPAAGAAPVAPQPAPDRTGYYEIKGKAPAGFAGFEGIDLTTVDFKPDGPVPIKPRGTVHARSQYRMARVSIEGERLSFETQAVRGTSYQFDGTFLNANPGDEEAAVLKGRLIKTVNGKKAAEAQVEFVYVEGVD